MKRKGFIVFLLVSFFLPFCFIGEEKEFFAENVDFPISSNSGGLGKVWEERMEYSGERKETFLLLLKNDVYIFGYNALVKWNSSGSIVWTNSFEGLQPVGIAGDDSLYTLSLVNIMDSSLSKWNLDGSIMWNIIIQNIPFPGFFVT